MKLIINTYITVFITSAKELCSYICDWSYLLYMPLPTVVGSRVSAQGQIPATTPLTQSRETGEVVPGSRIDDGPVAKQKRPEAKPWAHFVAGGYALPPVKVRFRHAKIVQPWGYDLCDSYIST